jgi:hypothetical protein
VANIQGRKRGEAMNLTDFETEQRGIWNRSVAWVLDVSGERTHQLTIEGPPHLVQTAVGDSNFDLDINPAATREE